ncbi:MAG TPA: hypothetical protein VGX50_10855 [Longimicrobium sp.]|jgi:hypothetical protein|nr:hypothetical protein [Longimicrobium sp.]
MNWEEIADRYTALISDTRDRAVLNHKLDALYSEVASAMPRDNPRALEWFVQALGRPSHQFFVAQVLMRVSPLPRTLVDPLLRAALLVKDASAPRVFIKLAVRAIGADAVHRRLSALASEPGVAENDGLNKARYWVGR